MHRVRAFPPLRIALAAGLLGALALGGWQQLSAQTFAGHNSNAPVNYAADRIELQDRNNRVLLAGNVDVTQENLRVQAQRVTVNYTDTDALRIQRMIASGGVRVTRGNETARGDVAVYDFNQRIITMAGNVDLQRAGDTLKGQRVVINLATGVSSVDGRGGSGRVSGTFSVSRQ